MERYQGKKVSQKMTQHQYNQGDPSPERLSLLLDRAEITDVFSRYGRGIDRCSVEQSEEAFVFLADCLVEDVVVDYGVGGMHIGRENWITFVKSTAAHMGRTLHLYTNVLVTVEGDQAHASCNVQATHMWEEGGGPRFLIAGGMFENEFSRTATGWQISRIVLHALFNNDPSGKLAELFARPSPS
jgi:hypothetical protein